LIVLFEGLVRYKYRAVNGKWMQRLDPVGGGWGMFGWHLITPRLATVVSSALTTTTSSTTSTTSTSSGSSSPLTEDHEMAIHSRSPRRKTTSVEQLINDTRAIVVTEGEFDAMSVYQATGIPAVSLPCGAKYTLLCLSIYLSSSP
jgi:twinkle protein